MSRSPRSTIVINAPARVRPAEEVSRATQLDVELPDPLSVAADTDHLHHLTGLLSALDAERPRLARPERTSALPALVAAASSWVARLAAALPPDADAGTRGQAGRFLAAAAELEPKPVGWRGMFGLLGGTAAPPDLACVHLLAEFPRVVEALLAALAAGFQRPEFAADWHSTAAAFQAEVRADFSWAVRAARANRPNRVLE